MNNNLVTKLLTYANSHIDCDQYVKDTMRKAALKIEYLEEVVNAVDVDNGQPEPDLLDVRGEDWYSARRRALDAGN